MSRVGIIAWGGRLPALQAAELRRLGHAPVVVAIEGFVGTTLEAVGETLHWVPAAKAGRVPKLLRREGVARVVFAGPNRREVRSAVPKNKRWIFAGFGSRREPQGELDLDGLFALCQAEGLEVLPQTFGMDRYVPGPGVLSKRAPTEEEKKDVTLGAEIGTQIADLGVGRTVVVKSGAILAVQGAEESDSTILRGGSLGGPGSVVVRAPCVETDSYLQAPTVSDETVVACMDAGAKVLAWEAGKTLIFERQRAVELADRSDLTLLVY